jgi:cyanophycinase
MNSGADIGTLLIIGGSEDRTDNMEVLRRFVELSGGIDVTFSVLTAASRVPEDVWKMYEDAFAAMKVRQVHHILTRERADADSDAAANLVASSHGILMTGGDQKRLMEILGGSAVEAAMRRAFYQSGACLAGTSAGASALCARMVADGKAELAPEKHAANMAQGMGFVTGIVIDQHFSQRHRINRLLSIITEHPSLMGAGIDENTGLVVHPGAGIEVVGEGCVSVLDCRRATTNIREISAGATPEIFGARLHLLPAGTALSTRADIPTSGSLPGSSKRAPIEIEDFVNKLINEMPDHEHR